MSKRKHLIIGCGTAALAAVDQIRQKSADDDVTIVTAEQTPPYSPTALPYVLSGRVSEEALWMRPDSYFDARQARLLLGKRLESIDAHAREVTFSDGSMEAYDTLLLALGSVPIRPRISGLEGESFVGFRTLSDCRWLRSVVQQGKRVCVLGAGLVGMEVAAGLLERGEPVTVVEKEATVLPLYFTEEAERYIREIFSQRGATLLTGLQATEVSVDGGGLRVGFAGGSDLRTDVLITAVGMRANTSPLEGSGIRINRGVVVDRAMKTSVEGIWAAGDLAEAPDFFSGQPGINPILPSAAEQGRIAGASMVGRKLPYEGWINMNVFSFFGHSAMSVGVSTPSSPDGVVLQDADDGSRRYKKLVFEGGRLVGAVFVNVPLDPGTVLYLIQNRLRLKGKEEALFADPRAVARALMLAAEKEGTTAVEQ